MSKNFLIKVMSVLLVSTFMSGNLQCSYATGLTHQKVTKAIAENPGKTLAIIGSTLIAGIAGTTIGAIYARNCRQSNIELQKTNNELQKSIDDLKSRLQAAEGTNSTHNNENNTLNQKISELENNIRLLLQQGYDSGMGGTSNCPSVFGGSVSNALKEFKDDICYIAFDYRTGKIKKNEIEDKIAGVKARNNCELNGNEKNYAFNWINSGHWKST